MTATVVEGSPAPRAPAEAPWSRRLVIWRSPEGQPGWSRPLLLVVALLAAALYTWRAGTYLELYYAAAVRSMSMSWHNFFFAAFDPDGTVTLDKLPGAFWLQALSVRAFGLHTWSIILPQVIEGVLSVLVVFRIVRRLSGPVAGILAAAVLALSPAAVALDRGNISDTLMILLLLLAADAAVTAVVTGRWRHMLLAGFWVGLAFQAKMVEAWLVLPALALFYLMAASGRWTRRLLQLCALGITAGVVSLSWMTVVTLIPASTRPYVDGSHDNSLFQQVFVYNGFGRLDQASPNQLLTRTTGIYIAPPPPAAWNRLLSGAFGRDIAWLIPAALIMAVIGLVVTRRAAWGDLARAGFVLWGAWLVTFALVFSFSSSINAYYTAALAPPIAGLVAAGAVLLWRERRAPWARIAAVSTVLITVGYAVWLLPAQGTGRPDWLPAAAVALGVTAATAVLLSMGHGAPGRLLPAGLVVAALALVLVPATASVSIASNRLGPFDTPFQPEAVTQAVRAFFGVTDYTASLIPGLEKYRRGAPYLMATQSSALAAPFIYVSGQEVLPIGGFTGTIPEPSLARIESMVHAGDFHLELQSPTTKDPRLTWIARHCLTAPQPTGTAGHGPRFAIYYCLTNS
ncbi:MAG: ArnT family glycosyltransferase [Acidimicrobiales bacterium]